MSSRLNDEHTTETAAAVEAGQMLALPSPLDEEGRFYSVLVPDGASQVIVDLELQRESFREAPRRIKGNQLVADADSFVAYFNAHTQAGTECWADHESCSVTGVLNGDAPGEPAWRDHRISYQLHATNSWRAWLARDGKTLPQVEFAEFVEEHLLDFRDPDGATMLEIATSIKAHRTAEFQSSKRLSNGDTGLVYVEETTGTSGRNGQLEIPETFALGLQLFEGGLPYAVEARLRWRMDGGKLVLGFKLNDPEQLTRDAFEDVTADIGSRIAVPLWRGKVR